jgi:hypothetical protein
MPSINKDGKPRAVRGTKPPRDPNKPYKAIARNLARDLVMDMNARMITQYDARTIVRLMEPWDNFGFIMPRELTKEFLVNYTLQEMNYDDMMGDPELAAEVLVYRSYDAVMVKNVVYKPKLVLDL